MRNILLPDKIRYRYRKFLLLWIPVRVYVIQTSLPAGDLRHKLLSVMDIFRLYFLYSPPTEKPYTGKFTLTGFTAVKNNPDSLHRPLKILGSFYSLNGHIYLRLIFSNPFSLINIALLGLLYLILIVFRFKPFPGILLNALFYMVPALFTYLLTNFSFQRIYKKEKAFFFHLFKSRRLKDDEIERLGI